MYASIGIWNICLNWLKLNSKKEIFSKLNKYSNQKSHVYFKSLLLTLPTWISFYWPIPIEWSCKVKRVKRRPQLVFKSKHSEGIILMVICDTTIEKFSRFTILPYILLMILRTPIGSKSNKIVILSILRFFGLC